MEALNKNATEKEVRDAITAFEQILEAIPNDRLALETLYDAYDQVGDRAKALEYLLRLSKVVSDEFDSETAPHLIVKLHELGEDDVAARNAIERLSKLVKTDATSSPETKKDEVVAKRKGIDITAELALAWNLVQAGELSQEDYANVVHDLSESSSKNVEVPVSVLHVLHDRGFKNLEKVLNFLAADSGLPLLTLSMFEMQKDTTSLLPMDYMKHRGAILFDLMGRDALIAILNPYDTELREDVAKLTQRSCHFYLVSAECYDAFLDAFCKAKKAEEAAAAGKK